MLLLEVKNLSYHAGERRIIDGLSMAIRGRNPRRRQIETLMAHGLTPDEALNVIVKGILR